VGTQRARRAPEKTEIMNFRIRPETKALLKQAAQESRRTMSAECEHQLRRALFDMGAGPTYTLLRTIGATLDNLMALECPNAPPGQWTKDSFLFNKAVGFVTAALKMFQPRPPIVALPVHPKLRPFLEADDKSLARAALIELLAEIAETDPSIPAVRQSRRQRALAIMKQDLGNLVDRPAIGELLSIAQKYGKNPDGVPAKYARDLWHIIGTLAGSVARRDREQAERTKS
jgi:hypothetical protein